MKLGKKPNHKCTRRRARLTSTVRGRRALRGAVAGRCTAECGAVGTLKQSRSAGHGFGGDSLGGIPFVRSQISVNR